MMQLDIYFNNLGFESVLANISSKNIDLYGILRDVYKFNNSVRLIFFEDEFLDINNYEGLNKVLRKLVGRQDEYRFLLKHVKGVKKDDFSKIVNCDREIFIDLNSGKINSNAISMVGIQRSWLVSLVTQELLFFENDFFDAKSRRLCEETADIIEIAERLKNIVNAEHIKNHRQDLLDWGKNISVSSVLDHIDGHPIVMYSAPREHNPPHVHVLQSDVDHRTIAKYNLENFALIKGDNDSLNSKMKIWVEKYKDQLLASWERCQAGKFPYRLNK